MKRPSIPQRRRVFFGCEGESEQSYGTLLYRLLEQRRRDVHLDVVLLKPGGGNPLVLVERAQKHITQSANRRNAPYETHCLLLDEDRRGQKKQRDVRALQIAETIGLKLIWQKPCHEAFLLRHLDGCAHLYPRTCKEARRQLIQYWPGYNKGLSAIRLSEQITYKDVLRAAKVERELATFLGDIGFIIGVD